MTNYFNALKHKVMNQMSTSNSLQISGLVIKYNSPTDSLCLAKAL